ncbi:hypothetical protein [Neobacillus sp.]|uniref:hypothetical protein n=1 Tax=Neobacillus sp. TaxID=2675273 RepID=UPI00289B5BF8|nr:hypothetical protein [Neobacillus sp.]
MVLPQKEEAQQIINQNPRNEYVDHLLPLFREGQLADVIIEGNSEELISSYLSILSCLMLLGKGYRIQDTRTLLRLVLMNSE